MEVIHNCVDDLILRGGTEHGVPQCIGNSGEAGKQALDEGCVNGCMSHELFFEHLIYEAREPAILSNHEAAWASMVFDDGFISSLRNQTLSPTPEP